MSIPNFNLPQYETLLYSLSSGTCIFFGAGVSKLAGYKLWNELRDGVIDFFWTNRTAISEDKRKTLDYSFCEYFKKHEDVIEAFNFLYALDKPLFIKGIKSIFCDDEQKSNNEIYAYLNRLNNWNNFFVTTNIDRSYQQFIGVPDELVTINPNLGNSPKLLNYIHGRVDKEDTWIFTRAQYNKGYIIDDASCMKFLINIFDNYNVLFVGYGLREDDIKRALSLTKKRKTHYWLEESSRNREDYLKIRKTTMKENYNTHLIPYYIDEEGHEVLLKVIDALYKAVNNKTEGLR
ncbi:MAG: SIR2 family protein [Nitrospirae bacterium]|nr:SIR2 family protein [Nitrospirota bacterium]